MLRISPWRVGRQLHVALSTVSTPNTAFGLSFIPPNSRGVVYLGEMQGDWLFVRYENRAEGWVHRRYVRPVTSRGRHLQ